MRISILANYLFIIAISLTTLILGKDVFVPLAFAILIAFLLFTPTKFLERKLPRTVSISIVFLVTSLILVGVITIFSFLLNDILTDINDVEFELENFVNSSSALASQITGINQNQILNLLKNNSGTFIEGPVSFISEQLLNSTTILFSAMITGILAFLLLLYRTAFKNFLVFQIEKNNREEAKESLKEIQKVSQQYLVGLLKVMLLLGTLNSLGLWAIGVKFPFFWGFFAALLTTIPFIGTFVGGLLPFIFVLVTTTTYWQPLAIVLMFLAVQFLEDNFIKPKIVGEQVDINPFVAILSLMLGGVIWGIPGFVLALPYVAILKIVLENFNETQSIAALMSSDIYDNPKIFKENFATKKYSFLQLFKLEKRKKK